MSDLHEKLRHFRLTWVTGAAVAPVDPGRVPGFESNADDTPSFWAGDIAAFLQSLQRNGSAGDVPRFANMAGQDEVQRAA